MKTKLKPYYLLKDDDELVMTGKQLKEWREKVIQDYSNKILAQVLRVLKARRKMDNEKA